MNLDSIIAKQVRALGDAQLAELAAAAGKVRVDLGVGAAAPTTKRNTAPAQKKAPVSGTKPRGPATKGEKRTPEVLASQTKDIADYIAANPGTGVEAMNKALGLTTKLAAGPIKKLMKGGAVRSEGTKRATRYFSTAA
jgi:hypothetical protein